MRLDKSTVQDLSQEELGPPLLLPVQVEPRLLFNVDLVEGHGQVDGTRRLPEVEKTNGKRDKRARSALVCFYD